jgi:hypothetical protein
MGPVQVWVPTVALRQVGIIVSGFSGIYQLIVLLIVCFRRFKIGRSLLVWSDIAQEPRETKRDSGQAT